MSKQRTKKFPILTYVCYLLALAILLTGVTLSRYVSSSGGNANVGISPFACSFTVDEISSTAFTNMNYWYGTSATNAPHSVGVTLRNYDEAGNISEVGLGSTLRICAPAELFDNTAFQLAENSNGSPIAVTPQYVFRQIVEGVDGGLSNVKYGAMDYPDEESAALTISGELGADGTGVITASSENGIKIEVKAERVAISYSVAFVRGTERTVQMDDGPDGEKTYIDSSGTVLYLDCRKEDLYYTVDITLPDSSFSGGSKEEKSYFFYFTTIQSYADGDYGADFPADLSKGLNGSEITGYHFDIPDVPLYRKSETDPTVYERYSKTSVRVAYSVGNDVADASVKYYIDDGNQLTEIDVNAANSDGYVACGESCLAVNDLYYDYTKKPDGSANPYDIGPSVGKIYPVEIKALFWQTSVVPADEGESL